MRLLTVLLLIMQSSEALAQTWARSVKRDEVTDADVFTLTIRSSTSIPGSLGQPTFPLIAIRCENGPEAGPEVFLKTPRAIDEEVLIMRWDQAPPDTTRLWTYSRDYSGLFADYPVKVLLDLATHRKLLVRYYPFAEGGPRTLTYALGSLKPFASDLLRYCGLEIGPMVDDYQARLARENATDAERAAQVRKAAAAERAAWNNSVKTIVLVPSVPTDTTLSLNQPLPIRPYILRVINNAGTRMTDFSLSATVEDGGPRVWRVEGDTLRIDTPGRWMVTFRVNGMSADHTLNVTVTDAR